MTVQNTRLPLTIFTGQQAQPRLVTATHGVIRPNLMDSFEITPKLSVKRIDEFDNLISPLIYYTFDGASGKLGYMESNQGQINALLMDLDPTAATQMVNPTSMKAHNGFMNLRGLDSQFKGSLLWYGALPSGNPLQMALKEGAKRSIDFEAQNSILFPGLAMLYTRARGATTSVSPPAVVSTAPAAAGGTLVEPSVLYVMLTAVTALGESLPGIEYETAIPVGDAANNASCVVTSPAIAGATTAYNVYVSDRSNGERYFGQISSGTTITVTGIPSTSAKTPPKVDTSGVFAASGDKVLTASGANWVVTLDQPAYKHPQSGLMYALICKDGNIIASVDNPATNGEFFFAADGTTFSTDVNPAGNAFDIFTLYQP